MNSESLGCRTWDPAITHFWLHATLTVINLPARSASAIHEMSEMSLIGASIWTHTFVTITIMFETTFSPNQKKKRREKLMNGWKFITLRVAHAYVKKLFLIRSLKSFHGWFTETSCTTKIAQSKNKTNDKTNEARGKKFCRRQLLSGTLHLTKTKWL